MHICMFVSVRMYAYIRACMSVCMYACMHVCMYACMYVRACVECMFARLYLCVMHPYMFAGQHLGSRLVIPLLRAPCQVLAAAHCIWGKAHHHWILLV